MRKLLNLLAIGVFAAAVLAVPVAALANHHRTHRRIHTRNRARNHHRARTTVREVNGGATGSGATVQSFQGGVLTIALHQTPTDTRTVSGQVNSGTEIKCETSMPTAQTADHGGRDDNSGDNNRGDDHGDNRGDDNEANDPEGVENENENEANDNEANENENENEANAAQCGPADLTPGTAVRDAELRIGSSSTAVFKEIDLVK